MEKAENILKVNQLPPGFRFDPTDEELVLHFLFYSNSNSNSTNDKPPSSSLPLSHHLNLIPIFHPNYSHPSQIIGKAFESYGKWYFYTRKSENKGYWREVGMDHPIFATTSGLSNKPVGLKKCLVYCDCECECECEGVLPSSATTVNDTTVWFMEEYHLCTHDVFATDHMRRKKIKRRIPHEDVKELVLCRVQHICEDSDLMQKSLSNKNNYEVELSSLDEVFVAIADEHEEISSPYY